MPPGTYFTNIDKQNQQSHIHDGMKLIIHILA